MKKVVIEIDDVRHCLVPDVSSEFSCECCSLYDLCSDCATLSLCCCFSNEPDYNCYHFELDK